MKKKGLLLLIAVLSFALVTVSGCKNYEKVRVVSGKVESLNMNGLRSADIVMSVTVDNPAGKIIVEEITGTLKHSGKVLGNVTLAPLTLKARSLSEYEVNATVELEKGIGLMYLMNFMDIRKLKECTVDFVAKGKASGIRVKREYKDIPVKKFLEEHHYEKI